VDAAFVLAVVATLAFAFTNGFHDAANAIATLVATRGARPGAAILLAAACNLLGPLLLGAAVADTIAGIVQVTAAQTVVVVGAALTAAVTWNLVTWWRGLPASSSHALVGGLTGAALVEAGAEASGAGVRPGSSEPWWRWRSRRSSGSVRPGRWNVACAVACAGPPPAPTGRCCGHSG
jgi:phosphate/sulfate permease